MAHSMFRIAAEPTPTYGRSNGGRLPWCTKPATCRGGRGAESGPNMPSLIRFLTVIGILAALVFGGLWSLAHFIEPKPREMTITIPQDRLQR